MLKPFADVASKKEMNSRIAVSSTITVSFGETSVLDDMNKPFKAFAGEKPVSSTVEFIAPEVQTAIPQDLVRYSPYPTHPIFNSFGPAT